MARRHLPLYLTSAGGILHTGGVSFTGEGALFLIGSLAVSADPIDFSGTGSLVATGSLGGVESGAVAFTGTGALAAAGRVTHLGVAAFSGIGALAAAGNRVLNAAVVFTGTGSLVVAGRTNHLGTVVFNGVGSLSAVGSVGGVEQGAVSFTGTGTLVAAGGKVSQIAVSFSGSGLLVAAGQLNGSSLVWLPAFNADFDAEFTPAWWHSRATHSFSVKAKITSGTEIRARLFNVTDAAVVAGSELIFSGTVLAYTQQTAPLTFPVAEKNYRAEVGKVGGSMGTIYRSRLIHQAA